MRQTNEFQADVDDEASPAAETTKEPRQRLADVRTQLGELDVQTRRAVKEWPMAALGIALAVGWLLGRALSRR